MKLSTNVNDYAGSDINFLIKEHKKAMKEGILHSIIYYSNQVRSNIGSIKFFQS